MDIKKVAVIGAGTMGNGIAQVFAQSGYDVTMIDVVEAQLQRGLGNIQRFLGRSVERGNISAEERDAVLGRIKTSASLQDAADAQMVVEAVIEDQAIKSKVLGELDQITRPEAILASNTSSISITELAASTKRPDKVIGMHFMNPVPLMKLVEIVAGLATNEETLKRCLRSWARLRW